MAKKLKGYWALYLKKVLMEESDPRALDNDIIVERADAAAGQFEQSRHEGLTVEGAKEMAYKVLLDGLFDE